MSDYNFIDTLNYLEKYKQFNFEFKQKSNEIIKELETEVSVQNII